MLREFLISSLILAHSAAAAPEIPVARFSAADLSGWSDKGVKGKTLYTLEDGALKAHSSNGASAKIKKFEADPKKYQRITWRWRVDRTLKHEDIREKSGDDFAARVYVVFPRSFFRMRAINYVWAARMPKDSEAPSPYTKNSVIIAVESGDEKAGKWVTEERNVYEDYKRVFGEEPPPLGGVAIMTDTDDTHEETTAWYGDITLHAVKGSSQAASAPSPAKGGNGNLSATSPPAKGGNGNLSATSPPAKAAGQGAASTAAAKGGNNATAPAVPPVKGNGHATPLTPATSATSVPATREAGSSAPIASPAAKGTTQSSSSAASSASGGAPPLPR